MVRQAGIINQYITSCTGYQPKLANTGCKILSISFVVCISNMKTVNKLNVQKGLYTPPPPLSPFESQIVKLLPNGVAQQR